MIRLWTLLCIVLLSLNAAEINWVEEYDEAIDKAKRENKNVMLLITSTTCRWCRKLEATTLKDESVVTRINKDYIAVHVTRNFDDYPAYLEAKAVPATYFLDTKGQPIIRKVMGYWNVEDYLSFLDDVDYKLGRKKY